MLPDSLSSYIIFIIFRPIAPISLSLKLQLERKRILSFINFLILGILTPKQSDVKNEIGYPVVHPYYLNLNTKQSTPMMTRIKVNPLKKSNYIIVNLLC